MNVPFDREMLAGEWLTLSHAVNARLAEKSSDDSVQCWVYLKNCRELAAPIK